MADVRIHKLARILVEHSTKVRGGDRVAITAATNAEPLVRAIYQQALERGSYPHVLFDLEDQDEVLYSVASEEQLDFIPLFHKVAFEEFDVLIKIRAEQNTRALTGVSPARQARRQKALSALLKAQMRRGADESLRWVTTLYPTRAYAMEAEMGFGEYQDFVLLAAHADEGTPDPVAHWRRIEQEQQRIVDRIEGRQGVVLRGPNVDLSLSIAGRKFRNASGQHNVPDGEIYTGPVEDSAQGWVRFTYPAVYQGRVVEGIELAFEKGRVVRARAEKNEDFLLRMLETDEGARYLGEFAIGTNFEIDRFTRNILLDEKIGGSFHLALGAGYPETGSRNASVIHWDMICDMREDAEMLVDGEAIYRNGQFIF